MIKIDHLIATKLYNKVTNSLISQGRERVSNNVWNENMQVNHRSIRTQISDRIIDRIILSIRQK